MDGFGDSDDNDSKLDLHQNINKPRTALDAMLSGFEGTKAGFKRSVRFSENLVSFAKSYKEKLSC